MTQTDSSISEKVQRIYGGEVEVSINVISAEPWTMSGVGIYLEDRTSSNDMLLEYQKPEWSNYHWSKETINAKLPRLFSFSCSRIDARHQKDDVERGHRVEYFQTEVPCVLPVTRNGCFEDIQVAGEKYGGIEGLGNEGYA